MATELKLRTNNPFSNGAIVELGDDDALLDRGVYEPLSSPYDKFHIVKDDEDLTQIAHQYYGDSKLWHYIAMANDNITDPFQLEVGTSLTIPDKDTTQIRLT